MNRALLARFSRFALVGGLGFIVDAGLTLSLIAWGVDPFSARVVAIGLAMLVTWRLNRAITFGQSGTSQRSEGLRYGSVALFAAALNYATYAALLLLVPGLWPLVAVAVATGTSMLVSYIGYSRFAFRQP